MKTQATAEQVNDAFKQACEGAMSRYIYYSEEPLVSVDYTGNEFSAIYDSMSTAVMEGNLLKVLAWYDNEYGYACRTVDLATLMAERM
jgi:glyceraldehyde 3-phosphate dehydrogenase